MWVVTNKEEMEALENQRALIGVFVDRNYNPEKIEWLFQAREGFDQHVGADWHLLIPFKNGYGVNSFMDPKNYGVQLAASIIDELEIPFAALPCVVFRASEKDYFFLKLGGMENAKFLEEIGRIADLAKECAKIGPKDPQAFKEYVNTQVLVHLRRRQLLSAAARALPALGILIGGAIDIAELV